MLMVLVVVRVLVVVVVVVLVHFVNHHSPVRQPAAAQFACFASLDEYYCSLLLSVCVCQHTASFPFRIILGRPILVQPLFPLLSRLMTSHFARLSTRASLCTLKQIQQ